MPEVIDYALAETTALRFVSRGPHVEPGVARSVVASLREVSVEAVEPVRACTGLFADATTHRTAIVARPEWIRANLTGFAKVMAPLTEKEVSAPIAAVGSRATAVELGTALSWLSTKVLGQYDIFGTGKLMLVAPNIAQAETQLGVNQRDFRLWVALHEETHRVQFGATPWLASYVLDQTKQFIELSELDGPNIFSRITSFFKALVEIMRGNSDASLIEAVQTPDQREIFDQLTALMTLLEGHADVVMDEVGPEVVPSVVQIREAFNARRGNPSTVDGLARRLLGMDAKLRQYTQGAAFVRAVLDEVGMESFNRVWTSPKTLPTRSEIAEPELWVARVVHG